MEDLTGRLAESKSVSGGVSCTSEAEVITGARLVVRHKTPAGGHLSQGVEPSAMIASLCGAETHQVADQVPRSCFQHQPGSAWHRAELITTALYSVQALILVLASRSHSLDRDSD